MQRRTIIGSLLALAAPAAFAAPDPALVKEVEQAVEAWRLAWELGEPDMYLRFYDPSFKGSLESRKQWEQQRRARLKREKISVKVDQLQVKLVSDTQADVRFVQHYAAGKIQDSGEKRLRMKRSGGAWRITQETWKAKR